MEQENSKTALALTDDNVPMSPEMLQFKQFSALAREIVTGGGLDATDAQAAVLMQRCKDLGIPWSTAVTNASIIKGKAGFDISVIRGLIVRSGTITWEWIKRHKPTYSYYGIDVDANGNKAPIEFQNEDELPPNYKIISKMDLAKYFPDKYCVIIKPTVIDGVPYNLPNDIESHIRFTRIRNIGGRIVTMVEDGYFSWRDAQNAGLHLGKDGNIAKDSPWNKYTKIMLDHRAFQNGAKAIAPDILKGMLERSELFEIEKIDNFEIVNEGTL